GPDRAPGRTVRRGRRRRPGRRRSRPPRGHPPPPAPPRRSARCCAVGRVARLIRSRDRCSRCDGNDSTVISMQFSLEFPDERTDTPSGQRTLLSPLPVADSTSMEPIPNPAPRILVAVDDPDLRRITVAGLRAGGFCVSAPTDGEAAMLLGASVFPDVLGVGARLLSPDGRPLYEALRESSEQYLVCITDEGATRARASVLLAGADD